MFATGPLSLSFTVCWAAFSAAAGSRLGLASGAATEGAMEPSTLPACPHVSHVSPSPLLVTCPLERFGLHFGLNKLLVSVILHVDMHLPSLGLLHQFWRDLTLHDALQELPVLRVVVQSDVPVVNTEAVSPHLQDESSGFFFLRCSTGSSDLTKGLFSLLPNPDRHCGHSPWCWESRHCPVGTLRRRMPGLRWSSLRSLKDQLERLQPL